MKLYAFESFETFPVKFSDKDGNDLEICEPQDAEFWTVYGRCAKGLAHAIADGGEHNIKLITELLNKSLTRGK